MAPMPTTSPATMPPRRPETLRPVPWLAGTRDFTITSVVNSTSPCRGSREPLNRQTSGLRPRPIKSPRRFTIISAAASICAMPPWPPIPPHSPATTSPTATPCRLSRVGSVLPPLAREGGRSFQSGFRIRMVERSPTAWGVFLHSGGEPSGSPPLRRTNRPSSAIPMENQRSISQIPRPLLTGLRSAPIFWATAVSKPATSPTCLWGGLGLKSIPCTPGRRPSPVR